VKRRYYVELGYHAFSTDVWESEQYDTFVKLCEEYCRQKYESELKRRETLVNSYEEHFRKKYELGTYDKSPILLAVRVLESWNEENLDENQPLFVTIYPDTVLQATPGLSTKIIAYKKWNDNVCVFENDAQALRDIEYLAKQVDGMSYAYETPEGGEGVVIPKVAPPKKPTQNPTDTHNNDEKQSDYDDGVQEFIRGLAKNFKDGTIGADVVHDNLKNSKHVSVFLAEKPEFKNKKKPTKARSIASALDHRRCVVWTNRRNIWKEITGAPPPRLRDVWDKDSAAPAKGKQKPGKKNPFPDSLNGFNTVEIGRIECSTAVEDCFLALNTRFTDEDMDYTLYREYFDSQTPLGIAEWIEKNVQEYKGKDIKKLANCKRRSKILARGVAFFGGRKL